MSFKAGSIIVQASSGSRLSINSVEPLISANKAVTVLRSPSARSMLSASRTVIGDLDGFGIGDIRANGVAHSAQNLALGGLSAPQDWHFRRNAAAQFMQNLAESGLSAPQFEQRTQILPG